MFITHPRWENDAEAINPQKQVVMNSSTKSLCPKNKQCAKNTNSKSENFCASVDTKSTEASSLCGTTSQDIEEMFAPVKSSTSKKKTINEEKTRELVMAQTISAPVSEGYKVLRDVEVPDSLINILKDHVKAMRVNPKNNCVIIPNTENGNIGCHIYEDTEFMIGTPDVLTNRPNLNFYMTLKTEEEKERFNKLENSLLYKDGVFNDSYEVECGEDAEKCAYLFSEIVQKVWGVNDEIEYEDLGTPLTYDYVCLHLNDSNNAWDRLSEMTNAYNIEAKANKYPQFELIASERLLQGSLPSYLDEGGALSKTYKTFKKMKKEFENIIELALKNLAK